MEPDTVVESTPPGGNNVWASIGDSVSRSVNAVSQAYRDISMAKASAAMAKAQANAPTAPSTSAPWGIPGLSLSNPLPGMFSWNPQADTKVAPGSAAGAMTVNPLFILAVIVALFFVFAKR